MFSHAVADAAFAGLNRAAQCFHIIPARLVEWAWFGHAETWNKNIIGNSCDGPSAHDVISAATNCLAGGAYRVRRGGSCGSGLPLKSDTCQSVGRIVHVKRLAATLMLCRAIVTKL